MPSFEELVNSKPDLLSTVWLAINYCLPFYQVLDQEILGFGQARELNRRYYEAAIKIALHYDGYWLEKEDICDIIEELGNPPDVSHPIYIITIKDESFEKVVYVGKSSSDKSRFTSGHSAAIKLLNPMYNSFEKLIYFGQIMTSDKNDEYLPLEFVGDQVFAEQLLDDIESKVIQHFKPELNTQKMRKVNIINEFSLLSVDYYSNNNLFDFSA